MINLEHKLTVDDLIVEYMIRKVTGGYEPSYTSEEFIDFLHFFTSKMDVEDCLYSKEVFDRFFERKNKSDWNIVKDFTTMETEIKPHMDLEIIDKDNYLIKANYKLSPFDISVINTYFIPSEERNNIRNIINEYLENQSKRHLDIIIKPDENEKMIGKCLASIIVENIWLNHINGLIDNKKWPKQCDDINKYLLISDLAEKIELSSIKEELLNLYTVLSNRIAIMYHNDKKLKISSIDGSYLGYSNYKLLKYAFEDLFDKTFGQYKKHLTIDIEKLEFLETHHVDGVYDYDDDIPVEHNKVKINDVKVKRLVKNFDKNI